MAADIPADKAEEFSREMAADFERFVGRQERLRQLFRDREATIQEFIREEIDAYERSGDTGSDTAAVAGSDSGAVVAEQGGGLQPPAGEG